MSRNENASARETESSKLLVKWVDLEGTSFTERTETYNISETGISFYLKTPIWVDTHVSLTIASSSLFGRLHVISAKVVRLQQDPYGRILVGARFDQ